MTSDTLILGATGRTGRVLTAHLRARGVTVRALVRDATTARSILGQDVQLVPGDLRGGAALARLADGCRQIVFVAGPNGLTDRGTPRDVEYAAVAALAAGLDPAQVDRFVLLSSAGVTQPEHPHNCTYDSVLKWKFLGEEALRRSGVAYTIVRALGLRDRPAGGQGMRMVQGDRIAFGEDIARDDLAAFLADIVAPRAQGFASGFDRASLIGATCEVFNDAAIPGGKWDFARAALFADRVIA